MVAFIDDHREAYGVEPICEVLPIAPSTYYELMPRAPRSRKPARAQREWHAVEIERVCARIECLRGAEGVAATAARGDEVARCTVERLMHDLGLRGVVRGRRVQHDDRATRRRVSAGLGAAEVPATRPNQLWVSDFTYVATWRGFVYVAFVIDVFARRIVGWRASRSAQRPGARRAGAGACTSVVPFTAVTCP